MLPVLTSIYIKVDWLAMYLHISSDLVEVCSDFQAFVLTYRVQNKDFESQDNLMTLRGNNESILA